MPCLGFGDVPVSVLVGGTWRNVVFCNVLHTPASSVNLLSIKRLTRLGLSSRFGPDGLVSITDASGSVRLQGQEHGHFFQLLSRPDVSMAAHATAPSLATTKLWHERLGHLGLENMRRLRGMSVGFDIVASPSPQPCLSCLQGSQHRLPFSGHLQCRALPLELIHSDKSEVLDKFKLFKTLLENQKPGFGIKAVRSDGGGEYGGGQHGGPFHTFLLSQGISHEITPPTPLNLMVSRNVRIGPFFPVFAAFSLLRNFVFVSGLMHLLTPFPLKIVLLLVLCLVSLPFKLGSVLPLICPIFVFSVVFYMFSFLKDIVPNLNLVLCVEFSLVSLLAVVIVSTILPRSKHRLLGMSSLTNWPLLMTFSGMFQLWMVFVTGLQCLFPCLHVFLLCLLRPSALLSPLVARLRVLLSLPLFPCHLRKSPSSSSAMTTNSLGRMPSLSLTILLTIRPSPALDHVALSFPHRIPTSSIRILVVTGRPPPLFLPSLRIR
jgi:hypothetical protein